MARSRELNSDQWRRSQLFINQAGEQYGRTAHTHTMQSGAATVAGQQSAIGIFTRTELTEPFCGRVPKLPTNFEEIHLKEHNKSWRFP